MTQFATAESEYNKDKKIRKEDVEALEEWAKKQPHLPKISEVKLIQFLQSNYYRLEATKTCIDKYYTIKAQCPDIFANRTVDSVKDIMSIVTATLLPKKSKNGYTVLFCKLMDKNSDNFSNLEVIKYFDMVLSVLLAQLGTCEGHVLVIDMEGLSLSHIAKVNINVTRKYMYFLQEALPIRTKEIHIVNVSALAQKLLNLVKSFINKDILDALHLHTSVDGLFEFIPKDALPSEYSGQNESLVAMQKEVNKSLVDNQQFLREDEKEIADETKRVGGKAKYLDEEPEMAGSFKKLDVF
ncbi:alpha-tocopherol transfer protein-like [Onthophagus taurus]|uniref:alpha-tocopherol transfer protein-like n=1 Tax=Onthophagus taurus TaxID=166361 RepID=UPI000C203D65|nr:SEC14-like protein 4 [Onthophagus taurus]